MSKTYFHQNFSQCTELWATDPESEVLNSELLRVGEAFSLLHWQAKLAEIAENVLIIEVISEKNTVLCKLFI